MTWKHIGRAVDRVDAPDKVTGAARYAADYYMDDMLYLRVLRSPHPHARIKKIDTADARALKGVKEIVTAADVPWLQKYGLIIKDQEVLVKDKVRFMGDALAIVAAESEKISRQAVRLIKVEYEELEVISDPLRAMEIDAPFIHEQKENANHHYNRGNVLAVHQVQRGDLEKGFAEADHILISELCTTHVEHVALQPEAGLAIYDPVRDRYTMWVATQWLQDLQADIAGALSVKPEQIQIIQPAIGGAFGKREDVSVHIYLALMARLTGKPVKMVLSRKESMISLHKRHPIIYRFKTGVTDEGLITAWKAEVIGDTGAYASTGPAIMRQALYLFTGPYNVPNLQGVAYTVYTNNTYCGAMRGFGATQAAFAYETHMDMIANKLGLMPDALRYKNAYIQGSITPTGQKLTTSVGVRETIMQATQYATEHEIPVCESPDKMRGRGIATSMFGCGYGEGFPDHSIVNLSVAQDGRILVRSGAADVGQGITTVITQIVGEVLNIPLEMVRVLPADTHNTKNPGSTSATRQTIFTGNATRTAAEALLGRIFHCAYLEMGCQYSELVVSGGRVASKDGSHELTLGELAELAQSRGEPLTGEGCYFPRTDILDRVGQGELVYVSYAFNTVIADVEVDTETGQVEVLRIVSVPDVGRAINPDGVEGQCEGGVAMGLGMALMEEQIIKDGITLNPDLSTYIIPTALDIPKLKTIIVESGDAAGPYGAKGVGEPALLPVAPAILNAVYNAVGVRIKELPATPAKILKALQEKGDDHK